MNKLVLFLCILMFVGTANAGDWTAGAGFSDLDGFDNGVSASLTSLNAVGGIGFGASMYFWEGADVGGDLLAHGFSGLVSFAIVNSDDFQFHVFANTPVYFTGVAGRGAKVDDGHLWDNDLYEIDEAERSFAGYKNGFLGPIVMFRPLEDSDTLVGLKVNLGSDIQGFEFMFSF